MDKMTAVQVLITRSSLLTDESKNLLLAGIENMGEVELDQLGIFLAQEKLQSIEDAREGMARVDAVLAGLDNLEAEKQNNPA